MRPAAAMQNQFSSALPDPSGNYTLFAPTDTAFFSLLTTYSEPGLCLGFGVAPDGWRFTRLARCASGWDAVAAATLGNLPRTRCDFSPPTSDALALAPSFAVCPYTDALPIGDRLTPVLCC